VKFIHYILTINPSFEVHDLDIVAGLLCRRSSYNLHFGVNKVCFRYTTVGERS
jgi:hypothetical protein